MSLPRHSLSIRSFGFALLAVGAAAMRHLFHMAQRPPATTGEALLAAAGFLCLSIGTALAALGGHVFDRVPISKRWTPAGITPDRAR